MSRLIGDRSNGESAPVAIEQGGENRGRIEGRRTEKVDGAVYPNQGHRFEVPDRSVVFDRLKISQFVIPMRPAWRRPFRRMIALRIASLRGLPKVDALMLVTGVVLIRSALLRVAVLEATA